VSSAYREVERKFRVIGAFALPDLAALPGVSRVETQPTFTMSNVYYDTPDLRLFRWGITLRRREGGPDEGWHLKLPVQGAGEGVRDEVREPIGPDLPAALSRLVTAFTRSERLGPVAALRTERTPRLLLDDRGVARIEVVDDRVTVMQGDRPASSFREIEAEAIPGPDGAIDEALLQRVSEALLAAGAVPGTMSKAGAALGPRAAVPAELPEQSWPAASAPAGEVVSAYLAHHARRLLLADLLLRRDLPDAVHQMRVSARRLRSGLKVFEPLVDREWAEDLRAQLGWMASGLGAARDTEVLIERLDGHAARIGEPDAAHARGVIDTALAARMADAATAVSEVVDSARYAQLLETLVDGVRRPPLDPRAEQPAEEALPPLVAKAFRRLQRRVAGLEMEIPSPTWHEARIAAKRARYAADAVAPVLGRDVGRLADKLADVTEVLGSHQDAHVAQATLRELVPDADPTGAFALGRLLGVEEEAEIADRRAFLDLWPSVDKAARKAGIAPPP
jgi:inorganic triphosphatase YgiF